MPASAVVLATIRRDGPLSRAAIAELTELSMPTVSRQITALAEAGLVCDVPERTQPGAIGRPRVPVDIDDATIAACGVHIGVSTTTIGLTDLRGRLLDSEKIPTPEGTAEDALAYIAGRTRIFLRRRPQRTVVGLGLATGGQVDTGRGLLSHERLGWNGVRARAVLERATGLPVRLDGHVPAMATAEMLFGGGRRFSSLLYFYARQVVGIALAVDGVLHRGPGRAGTVAHLPVGGDTPCPCGRLGCLEATVNAQTTRGAYADRAETLGRAIALLRDLINPDHIVLGGQVITDAPEQFSLLLRSFSASTALPDEGLVSLTSFGPNVQAVAACTGVLEEIYRSPLRTDKTMAKAVTG